MEQGIRKNLWLDTNEVIGFQFDKIIPIDYVDQKRENVLAQLEKIGVWRGETRQCHKNGKTMFIQTTVSQIKNDHDESVGYVAINSDITERKQSEEALKDSEARLQSLIDQSIDPITLIDLSGSIVLWNQAQEKITGLRFDQIKNKKIWDVQWMMATKKDQERLPFTQMKQNMQAMLKGISGVKFQHMVEVEMVNTLGNVRHIQQNMFNITYADQIMVGSFSRDITELKQVAEKLRGAYSATIEGWGKTLELRDRETEGHSLRVTDLTVELAKAYGIAEDKMDYIRWGAILHDIGKMGIPDSILQKADNLNDTEWKVMKNHPQLAYDFLKEIDFLKPALDIPTNHHEKWNGTGYPQGLKGEEIPIAARLFAIVDVWDALRSDRPYRKAWSAQKAIDYIQDQSGTHFDPDIVDVFIKLLGTKKS